MSRCLALTKSETKEFQRTVKDGLMQYDLTAADALDHDCYVYEMFKGKHTGRTLDFSREDIAQAQGVFLCPCAAQQQQREQREQRELQRTSQSKGKRKGSGQVIQDALRPYCEKRHVTYQHACDVLNFIRNARKTREWRKARPEADPWETEARKLWVRYVHRGNLVKPGDALYGVQPVEGFEERMAADADRIRGLRADPGSRSGPVH